MSSTLRLSRGFIAAIITICVFFTCLPFNRTVRADGPVTYYVHIEEDGENDRFYADTNPAGCIYVYYEGYSASNPAVHAFSDVCFAANNSYVVYNDSFANLNEGDYDLFNSTLIFSDGVEVSTDSSFAFQHAAGWDPVNNTEDFEQLFNYLNMEDDIGKTNAQYAHAAYKYTFTQNYTFGGGARYNAVEVKNNATLTLEAPADAGNNQPACIDVKTCTVASGSHIVIKDRSGEGQDPNGLNIDDDGVLHAAQGAVTGEGNAVLEFRTGARVEGGLQLFQDSTSSATFTNQIFLNTESFHYEDGKWILNGHDNPPAESAIYFNFEKDYLLEDIEYYAPNANEWRPLDGEDRAKIDLENIGDAYTVQFRFKTIGTLAASSSIKFNDQAVANSQIETSGNTTTVTLIRPGSAWSSDSNVTLDLRFAKGIYIVNCTENEISVNYGFTENSQPTAVTGGFIASDVLGNNDDLYFKITSANPNLDIGFWCPGNHEDNRDFHPENGLYYVSKGDGWDKVLVLRIDERLPGIAIDDRGGMITGFTFATQQTSGNVENNFIAKDVYKDESSITINYTVSNQFNFWRIVIRCDGTELVSGTDYTYDLQSLTINKGSGWGQCYDIDFQDKDPASNHISFSGIDHLASASYRTKTGGTYSSSSPVSNENWTVNGELYNSADLIEFTFVPSNTEADLIISVVDGTNRELDANEYTFTKNQDGSYTLVLSKPSMVWDSYFIDFRSNGGPDPTPVPGNDILSKVEGHGFAYYTDKTSFSEKAADLKNCTATEIYCYFTVSQTHDYPTFADLLSNLNCTSTSVEAADDEVGLPYVWFTLTQGSLTTAPFKVYILDSATKFIIKTCVDKRNVDDPNDDAYVYTVVDPGANPENGANQITVRMNYLEAPTVFGNGVSTIDSSTNNENNIVLHVTQDNSNIDLHFADTPEHELFPTNSVGKINTYLTVEKYEIKTLNAAIAGTKLLITGTTSGSKTGDPVYVAVYKDAEKIASGLFSAGSDQSHSFSGEISIAGHGITNPSQIRVYASDREDGVMVTGTVEVAVVVSGYNIRLDGYVGVSYWLTLSSAVEEFEPSVTFTYDSQVNELKSQTVAFADSSVVTVGNNSYRVYSCKVASPEMTCAISATLTYGNTSIALESKTARQIVKSYADNQGNSELLKGLARKILNYGYYSQKYFRPDLTLNNEDDAGLDPIPSNLEGPAIPQQLPEGIQYSSTGVVFNSGNKIKFYFTIDSGVTPVITLDGENANLVASGQRYYVYLDQISIAELGRNIVVSINGECTFTYSVLNYIALVRDSDKVDEDAKKVVQALYMYYLAAEAYGTSTEA